MTTAGQDTPKTPKPWSAFDPPPMTLVLPDEKPAANPPLIMWQPVPGAVEYHVRITGPASSVEATTRFNFFTPDAPLPLGVYAVSVKPTGEGSAVQGELRITREGQSPGPLNALRADSGARLLLNEKRIASIRNATGEAAQWRERLLQEAKALDPELEEPLREPRRYADCIWNFHDWHANNQYVIKIENAVLTNVMAYALTGGKSHAGTARRLAMELARWDPTGATGMWENDHSAHAVMNALAITYDTLGDELSAEDRATIRASIAGRCEDALGLLNPFVVRETSSGPMNDPDNNHPWFSASAMGMGALAVMDEENRAPLWLACAAQLYWGLFLARGGRDGGWHEGIDYWSYSLFFVFQFADALKNKTGADLYRNEWLRQTGFFKMYAHPPAGGYAPFGDCKHHAPNAFDKIIMMRLAMEYADPLAWKYVDAIAAPLEQPRYLFWALLWFDRGEAENYPTPEIPFAKHFRDTGWVVSCNDLFNAERQAFFAVRCGPFHGRAFGHTHGDQNSFVLAVGGEKLLWDAGYYDSYLSPHHRQYSRHSHAHNTVLVDGEGQVVHLRGIDGRIAEFRCEGDHVHVAGDASEPLIYGGKLARFIRTFDYRGLRELTIEDEIIAREPARLSFLLHSVYPMVYDAQARMVRVAGEKYEAIAEFQSAEPVDVIIRTAFEQEPNLTSNVLDEDMNYPPQFHLEFRTLHKIAEWHPRLNIVVRERKE